MVFINLVFKRLQQLLKAAYCKYSNYPVACLIETNDGWYAGVNVENGSFGLTICAERNAIANVITNQAQPIKGIYLLTTNEDENGTPCGACRQVMAEFIKEQVPIVIFNALGKVKKYYLNDLLPYRWSSKITAK